MEKYKVKLTFIEEVEATNEQFTVLINIFKKINLNN